MFGSTTPPPLSLFIGGADHRRRSVIGHKMLSVALLLISTLSALTQGKKMKRDETESAAANAMHR